MHALVWISLIMPQFALPIRDSATSPDPLEWELSGDTELWRTIDDPVAGHDGDSTYAHADGPDGQEFHVDLEALDDPERHTGHIVHFYAKRLDPVADAELFVALHQGTPTIASRTFFGLSTPYLLFRIFLTETEASAITDYAALWLEIQADSSNSDGEIRLTQIYLEVPIAPLSSSVTAVANASAASRRLRRGSSSVSAVATPTTSCVRLRQGGASPALAVATASQPNPMLILRDRAHGAAQVLRPIGDVSNAGNWINEVGSFANLALSIDEVNPDDDVTWVEPFFFGQIGVEFTVAVTPAVDPLRDADHSIFFRAKKVWSGNPSGIAQLFVVLFDGLTGNLIHSAGVLLETVYKDFVIRIPESSASGIENYGNLRLQVVSFSGVGDPGTGVKPRLTHLFLRAPETNLKRPVRGFALADAQGPRRTRNTVAVPSDAVALGSGLATRIRRQDTSAVAIAAAGADARAVKAGSAAATAIATASAVATKSSGIGSSETAVANAQATSVRVRRASSSVAGVATATALSTRIRLESGSSSVVARATSAATAIRRREVTATATAIANATATATKLGSSITSAVTATANATATSIRVRPATSAVIANAIAAAFVSGEPSPPPTGACCLPDGSCLDGQTAAQCAAAGGIYQGNTTTCVSGSTLPQFALPIATVAATETWESQPGQADEKLNLNLDEAPAGTHDGNTSYISGEPPIDQEATFRMAPLQPPSLLFDVKLHVVHLRPDPKPGDILEAKLWQGYPSGMLIATHKFSPSSVWIDEFYQLSLAEAQSITDWTDLYVSLVLESDPPTGELRITQVYLETAPAAFSFIDCSPPGTGTKDEQCGIKLIPYREPVYPYKRRMAGLLKGGRIAVCVPTRSAQHGHRRTWVGALRSDGQIGEGAPQIGKTIVGHAARAADPPARRFAIARLPCDRGCTPCTDRVISKLCLEITFPAPPAIGDPGGVSLTEFALRGCVEAPLPRNPFSFVRIGGTNIFEVVGTGFFGVFKRFRLCDEVTLPGFLTDARFVLCRAYEWRTNSSQVFPAFGLSELYFEEGGFAGYLAFLLPRPIDLLNPPHLWCSAWVSDQQWPFEPTTLTSLAISPFGFRDLPTRLGRCDSRGGVA